MDGGRKALYYGGKLIGLVGVVLFLSVVVTFAQGFGDLSDFEGWGRSGMMRGLAGMALVAVGGAMAKVGARGLAGAGVVLDPERARRDLEPWSRMGGGMLADALDEAHRDEPPTAGPDFDATLRKLHQLHQDGILSDEEYAKEKREVLERI